MTSEDKSFFREKGYLFLRGGISKDQVKPVKDYILNELKRLKIWSSGKFLSASIKKIPAFQQITKISGLIKPPDIQSKMMTRDVRSMIDALAEGTVATAQSQLLVSLPNQGCWTLNGLNWHTDISSSIRHRIPGIQVFVLIDDVKVHGGATLAIAGSHALASHGDSSRKIREMLRNDGDLERELRSNNLSIVEMHGQAGDIYLMDMRMLHTPSINSTDNIRMMATLRYLSV